MVDKIRSKGHKGALCHRSRVGRPRKLKFLQDMRQNMRQTSGVKGENVVQPATSYKKPLHEICPQEYVIDALKARNHITMDQFYAGRFFLTWWRKNCKSLDIPQWARPNMYHASPGPSVRSSDSLGLVGQTEDALSQWLSQDTMALRTLRVLNEKTSDYLAYIGAPGIKKISEYLTHICLIFNHLSL